RARWVVAGLAAAAAGALVVVLVIPGAVGLHSDSEQALNRAASGRASLGSGALKMARGPPLWGGGAGSVAAGVPHVQQVITPQQAKVSHTIPLTVAAEQGAIGLVAYVVLLWAAARLLFAGLRGRLARRADTYAIARAAVAATFVALVVHTLAYAAYLEDPLTWTLLALGAALFLRPEDEPAAAAAAHEPAELAPLA